MLIAFLVVVALAAWLAFRGRKKNDRGVTKSGRMSGYGGYRPPKEDDADKRGEEKK